jgi:hypothetical protein
MKPGTTPADLHRIPDATGRSAAGHDHVNHEGPIQQGCVSGLG